MMMRRALQRSSSVGGHYLQHAQRAHLHASRPALAKILCADSIDPVRRNGGGGGGREEGWSCSGAIWEASRRREQVDDACECVEAREGTYGHACIAGSTLRVAVPAQQTRREQEEHRRVFENNMGHSFLSSSPRWWLVAAAAAAAVCSSADKHLTHNLSLLPALPSFFPGVHPNL